MPTQYWRSPETVERLAHLGRPGFAAEFLHRNLEYRRDFERTQRQIADNEADPGANEALGRRWGCIFPHDPSLPVVPGIIAWRPEVSPATLLLDAAPSGFAPVTPLDLSRLGAIVADVQDGDERELVVFDGADELHLRLRSDQSAERPAVLVPADSTVDLRLDVALRFVRRLRGQSIKLLPAALRLTVQQRRRLVQLLHAFDIHDTGGGPRDVAELVLRSEHAKLPSVEWKDSHARRTANRLIHDSMALVEHGYLKLLRGG